MNQNRAEKKSVYSYHTFIFPFLWNNAGAVTRLDFERCIDKSLWKLDLFDTFHDKSRVDELRKERYDQYQYFNAPARRAVYTSSENSESEIVRNYIYKPELFSKDDTGAFYVISKGSNTYKLHISGLRLKLYNSGIGMLVYELENTDYTSLAEVNRINEYGRRIFCPYISGVNDLTSSLTADSIRLEGANFSAVLHEDEWRISADASVSAKAPKAKLAKIVTMLLTNESVSVTTDHEVADKDDTNHDTLYIEPIIDDRMFVACFVHDKAFVSEMAEWNGSEYRYLSDAMKNTPNASDSAARKLYEFVFVDGDGISCVSRNMLYDLLKEHVYDRWLEYYDGHGPCGSIYGITEYSMVCASATNFLASVFLTEYIELAMLTLAQRASLIAFERQISIVSTSHKKEQQLMENYVHFQSQLLFNEVTPQQQGIELYDMLLETLFINKQKDDVEKQIQNLFNIKNFKTTKLENRFLLGIAILEIIPVIDTLLHWFWIL